MLACNPFSVEWLASWKDCRLLAMHLQHGALKIQGVYELPGGWLIIKCQIVTWTGKCWSDRHEGFQRGRGQSFEEVKFPGPQCYVSGAESSKLSTVGISWRAVGQALAWDSWAMEDLTDVLLVTLWGPAKVHVSGTDCVTDPNPRVRWLTRPEDCLWAVLLVSVPFLILATPPAVDGCLWDGRIIWWENACSNDIRNECLVSL